MRRKLVVGNWKMNGGQIEITQLLAGLLDVLPNSPVAEIAVCPPFVYLALVRQLLSGSSIKIGAQNVSNELKGAFTGEIAATMLRECGCDLVIVGHSERRSLYGESDALVAAKTAAALQHELTPIVCVGESLAERDAGLALEVIGKQLDAVMAKLSAAELVRTVFAYEPVWAIGTGRTATPEQAQQVHAFIRQRLAGSTNAQQITILYGGSVKADNAKSLFAQPDIDGGLVGGASLQAEEFAAICAAAE